MLSNVFGRRDCIPVGALESGYIFQVCFLHAGPEDEWRVVFKVYGCNSVLSSILFLELVTILRPLHSLLAESNSLISS